MGGEERTKDRREKMHRAEARWVLGWRHTITLSTSTEFIIYNGKSRRWAAVLQGMGRGIIVLLTGESCDCFSLNVSSHVYILGKTATGMTEENMIHVMKLLDIYGV
jgi:hypothetical protein